MFYKTKLSESIAIQPSQYTKDIRKSVTSTLYATIEGRCTHEYGYIISVLGDIEIGEGSIQQTGVTVFDVNYEALVLKVDKEEVIDAIVVETNNMGVFAQMGPVRIFVSNYQMMPTAVPIQRNDLLRLRVIGVKVDAKQIFAIGSTKEDFLGVIRDDKIAS